MWLDIISEDGAALHFNNLVPNVSGALYHSYSYNSNVINIVTQNNFDWTRQFSYYIHIIHDNDNDNMQDYLEVANTSEIGPHISQSNESTIRYLGNYNPQFQHSVMYNSLFLFEIRDKYIVAQSYMSIALGQNCSDNHTQFLIVFNYIGSDTMSTNAFVMDSVLEFDGCCVYFTSMIPKFSIDFTNFPLCEVVVSYRMIERRFDPRIQQECDDTFYQVIV